MCDRTSRVSEAQVRRLKSELTSGEGVQRPPSRAILVVKQMVDTRTALNSEMIVLMSA